MSYANTNTIEFFYTGSGDPKKCNSCKACKYFDSSDRSCIKTAYVPKEYNYTLWKSCKLYDKN